jgi:hypothetical protein
MTTFGMDFVMEPLFGESHEGLQWCCQLPPAIAIIGESIMRRTFIYFLFFWMQRVDPANISGCIQASNRLKPLTRACYGTIVHGH